MRPTRIAHTRDTLEKGTRMLVKSREGRILMAGHQRFGWGFLGLFPVALLLGAPPAAQAKDLQTKLAESFYLRLPHALEVATKSNRGGSPAHWREQVPEESTRPSPGARLIP